MELSESVTRQFILNENTPYVINETYAAIRTRILDSLSGASFPSFVVTSQCRNEGKTTTAVNLAIMMSRLEKRVLLIDCDLRRSNLPNMLRIKNRFGLSNILAGECDIYDGICADVRTNFHVITSGAKTDNPSGLLAGGDMERFVRILYEYYDYIILDTPPLCIANDAMLFGGYTGGVVFILRENKTTHKDMRAACSTLKLSKSNVIGVVKTYSDIRYRKKDEPENASESLEHGISKKERP